MGDFTYSCRQHFSCSSKEALHALVTSIVAGFVISFDDWGAETVNVAAGIQNFILGTVFVLFALSIQIVAMKLVAVWKGYTVEYSMWKLGLLFSLLVTFLTNGIIPLFFTGSIDGNVIKRQRVGTYMPRFKNWEFGLISLAGPLSNLFLALILQPLYIATQASVINYFLLATLLTMSYSLLPIPLFHGVRVIESGRTEYDWEGSTFGFNIFVFNRFAYVFFASASLAYTFLALLTSIYSFLLSMLIAIIVTAVFYVKLESE